MKALSLPAKHSTRALFGRLLREAVRPYAGRIGLAVLAMAIAAGAQGMTAWLMEPVVDQVFSQKDKSMLWPVAVAVLATFAVKGIAEYTQSGLMSHVGLRAIADLQNRLYGHLTRQDVAFFQAHKTGSLVSRFLVDVNLLRAAVSNGITGIGKDALTAAALIGVMFYQDAVLAAAAFLVFPIAIYPVARLGKRMRRVSVNTQEQMGALNTLLEQSFAGIRMVKAYRMERVEQGRVAELTETVYRLTQKGALTRAASSPIMEMMGGLAVTVVIVYGGLRVIEGVTTTGAFFSFITALMMAYRPLKSLANLNTVIQEGMGAAERLFDVLDTRPAITDAPDAKPLDLSGGHVRMEGVTFRYDAAETGDRPALHGLDLDVPAGRTVALVGPSGSGKSTVMNMIPRFYDATEGRVTVDGQDVRAVTLDSLRDAVALVSQEVVLFDDTVAANIAFGRPGASRDDIETAARNAAAHEFITALPHGYDTIVGERGLKLSGGQRQRLSIARAMLKNAPILLLDEATSALDTESERQVQGALEKLMRGRTTLVIAHRLSTVTNADLIHVIDSGRLVESGTHDDLLRKGGAYARLYQLQFAAEQAPGQGGGDIALAP